MKQPRLSDLKIDAQGTKAVRKLMAKSKKVKITVNVDEDLLVELRKMSVESGVPYQTLLNRTLREAVYANKDQGSRLDRIEKELDRLKKKLSA